MILAHFVSDASDVDCVTVNFDFNENATAFVDTYNCRRLWSWSTTAYSLSLAVIYLQPYLQIMNMQIIFVILFALILIAHFTLA